MTARKIHHIWVCQQGITMMEFLGYLAVAALLVAGALGMFIDGQFSSKVELAYMGVQNVVTEAKKVAPANAGVVTVADIKSPDGWVATPTNSPTYLNNASCACTIDISNGPNGTTFVFRTQDADLVKALDRKKVAGVAGTSGTSSPSSTVRWTIRL